MSEFFQGLDLTGLTDDELLNHLNSFSSKVQSELKNRGYEYGWHKKEPFVGVIYILVNPAFQNLVKIGYANNLQSRLKTLNSNSGLPDMFHCYAIFKVKKRLEDGTLHNLIDTLNPSLRHVKNREFYEMSCQQAYEIIAAIAQINGNSDRLQKNPLDDDFIDSIIAGEKGNKDSGKKQSRLTFGLINIPVGSTLVFSKDSTKTCITADDVNKVNYQGKEYSISGLAKMLLGVSAVQGGQYFMYKGELLTDIRDRLGV